MMKTLSTFIFVFVLSPIVRGQTTLTLGECYERAEANYPLIRQKQLLRQTAEFSMDNASKGRLPQITLGGQATYQSEVTRIPLEMPGVEPLDKDQYRIFGEISQTLYHGGLVGEQVRAEEMKGQVEEGKLATELYQVRDRINDLFFGMLLLRAQMRQNALVKSDLNTGLKKAEAAIANGAAIRSDADILRAELLRADQRLIELLSAHQAYAEILGTFIGASIDTATVLAKPQFDTGENPTLQRPELTLFQLQQQSIDINRAMLGARKRPRLELFVQGGYGRPGLNMLENEFNFYYLGGLRLSWLLSGYYTLSKEKQVLDLTRQSIGVQEETFRFNTRLALSRQDAEIDKLQRLIKVDQDIISLRERVEETASVQLEQGVISASDYVRDVNAADQARQDRALHETQLLMAQAKYQFIAGQ